MNLLLSIFMILVTLHGTFSCMKKNVIRFAKEINKNILDKQFCCPYCFEKFILKQLFQDHLLTHPEVTALGPIPGHTPYLGIYSTPEDIEKKCRLCRWHSWQLKCQNKLYYSSLSAVRI